LVVENKFADCGSVRLRYVERGDGYPVILVHGYMVDLDYQWTKPGVFDALSQDFRVVAYDNRGHGQSQKFHRIEDYGDELANDVFRLMDALQIEKAHIVGYSMGAMIVARSTAMRRGRFTSVTLGGGAGRFAFTQEERDRNATDAAAMRNGDISGHLLRLWPSNVAKPDAAELKRLTEQTLHGRDPLSLAAVREGMEPLVVPVSELAASTEPFLGLVGTEDPFLVNLERLKQAMPEMELVTIEGASHDSAPGTRDFIDALASFLKRHTTS
jgi:pimeloyl-ACP methyl ester carboxylesterase